MLHGCFIFLSLHVPDMDPASKIIIAIQVLVYKLFEKFSKQKKLTFILKITPILLVFPPNITLHVFVIFNRYYSEWFKVKTKILNYLLHGANKEMLQWRQKHTHLTILIDFFLNKIIIVDIHKYVYVNTIFSITGKCLLIVFKYLWIFIIFMSLSLSL